MFGIYDTTTETFIGQRWLTRREAQSGFDHRSPEDRKRVKVQRIPALKLTVEEFHADVQHVYAELRKKNLANP